MAICDYCKQEMTDAGTLTCKQIVEFPDGTSMDAIPYIYEETSLSLFEDSVKGGSEWAFLNPEVKSLWDTFSTPEERKAAWKLIIGTRCHDCKVVSGGLHHPGCDAERCPRCKGQLISCGCLEKPEKEDDDQRISFLDGLEE